MPCCTGLKLQQKANTVIEVVESLHTKMASVSKLTLKKKSFSFLAVEITYSSSSVQLLVTEFSLPKYLSHKEKDASEIIGKYCSESVCNVFFIFVDLTALHHNFI